MFPPSDEVRDALVPSPIGRWCSVIPANMDEAIRLTSAEYPGLDVVDTSPTVEETDRISAGGLGLHTDGYSEVPFHPEVLLLEYSRPVEIRVLGLADVLNALQRVTGSDRLARRLAGIEMFVDPGATTARANLFRLDRDGSPGAAVLSPVARATQASDNDIVRRWVDLWRSLDGAAPVLLTGTGETVAIRNRLAAHARIERTTPDVRLRRTWLSPRSPEAP